MGFFSNDFVGSCVKCGAQIKMGVFSGNGFQFKCGTCMCFNCAKKLQIPVALTMKETYSNVENIFNSKKQIENNMFSPNKRVFKTFLGNDTQHVILSVDKENELVNIPIWIPSFGDGEFYDNIHKFSEIVDFEYLENGVSLGDQNSIIRAGVGGILFGGIGAIVGAGTGKKKTEELIKQMQIKVIFNNIDTPECYIDFLGFQKNGAKKTSREYKGAFAKAQECLSILSIIVKRNQHNTDSSSDEKSGTSVADELLKFKQLLDMGAISQEEFDKKKIELLG